MHYLIPAILYLCRNIMFVLEYLSSPKSPLQIVYVSINYKYLPQKTCISFELDNISPGEDLYGSFFAMNLADLVKYYLK